MSARAEMTSPRVVRDLLIKLPSLSLSPSAPVLETLSLPARSTKLILDTFSVPVCNKKAAQHSTTSKIKNWLVRLGQILSESAQWRRLHVSGSSLCSSVWLQQCETCCLQTLSHWYPTRRESFYHLKIRLAQLSLNLSIPERSEQPTWTGSQHKAPGSYALEL